MEPSDPVTPGRQRRPSRQPEPRPSPSRSPPLHPRGPNPLGYADHKPFAAFGAELVYGERADGTLAHIAVVASGLACACTCPACGRTLIGKKGRKTAAHFSHHGNATGCGKNAETNAHIWAKEVLNREKLIMLPAVRATVGKETLQTYRERMFEFENAELEKSLGDIVPDVMLTTKDGRQMLVEVMVTHGCGPEKIAKLRDRGLATLEVDLSRWRKSSDRHEIEQALVTGAPRVWLFNRKAEEAEARLATGIAERAANAERAALAAQVRADAADRLRETQARRKREEDADRIVRAVARIRKGDAGRAERQAIAGRGLLDLLDPEQNAMGFTTDNEHWQAAIIERMIEAVVDDFELPEFTASSALQGISDCLAPGMPESLPPDVRSELPLDLRSLDLPLNAVRTFLLRLCDRNVLWCDGFDTFTLPDDRIAVVEQAYAAWQQSDRRRRSVETTLDAIVDGIPVEEHGDFVLEAWRIASIPGLGRTIEELILSDTPVWEAFETKLSAIRRMIDGGTWVGETMGLPLHGELLRAERRASQLRDSQATEREDTLSRAVVATLGEGGMAWMKALELSGVTPAQQARGDAAGLSAALRALEKHAAALAASTAADKRAADYRQRLSDEAEKGLGRDIAQMFLTYHDAVLGTSPWNACCDAAGLHRATMELAKWIDRKRKTRKRR